MRFGPVTISPSVASFVPWTVLVRSARSVVSLLGTVWPTWGDRALGRCVVCHEPVYEHEPFLRHRGLYYHAGPCLERDPPALRTRTPRENQGLAG